MKKTLLSIVLIILAPNLLLSQTYISGNVSGTWNSAGNPYLIEGDCQVPDGQTLQITEGVIIEFLADYEFLIEGTCTIMGTVAQVVDISGTTGGFITIDGGEGDWSYLLLSGGVESITLQDGFLTLNQVEIAQTNAAVIEAGQSTLEFTNCTLSYDGFYPLISHLITASDCDITFEGVEFWSNTVGFLSGTDTDVQIVGSDLTYDKDDWFDTSTLLYMSGGELSFTNSTVLCNVDATANNNEATIFRLESLSDAVITSDVITGVVILDDDTDAGSIVGIYGGSGRIATTVFDLSPDMPSNATAAEIDLVGVQYYSGDIDSCNIRVTAGYSESDASGIVGVASSEGSFTRNLIIVEGAVSGYCFSACDAEIINNTVDLQSENPTGQVNHIAISSCYGTLKNNIITGTGTALSPPETITHTYNCYWGFGEEPDIPPLYTGEVYADPQLNALYKLTSLSPCINSGDPTSPLDPDGTRADMGAYFKDQSDRPVITAYSPQGYTGAPEHTSQEFWISATDPVGQGLSYLWLYRGDTLSTDSITVVDFLNAGLDSVIGIAYNVAGNDSQKWVFELDPVNINIEVPGDYATIQEALENASYVGDTIRLAEGIYYENLSMIDKSVSIIGSGEPEAVIIDGADAGSVLTIENCTTGTAFIANLTLQNGAASVGGGVCALNFLLNIQNCRVVNNRAFSDVNSYGGGVYLDIGSATIEECEISGNTVEAAAYGRGGGLYCNGLLELRDCTVINNSVLTAATMASGGGIQYSGGGALIEYSIIRENTVNNSDFLFGGGINCTNAELRYLEIVDNSCNGTGQAKGGGISVTHTEIDNCTIARNQSTEGAGIYIQVSGSSNVHNSIVALNEGQEQISSANISIAGITYSNFFGSQGVSFQNCIPGEGTLEVDPQFVGGNPFDVHLTEESPCIDAGDPVSPLDPDNTRADMGCYYFDALAVTADYPLNLPLEYALYPPYPNPFNPTVTLQVSLPQTASATLTVYDLMGRQVARLFEGELQAGAHRFEWQAERQSSGVYFVRYKAGNFTQNRKLLLVK